MYSKYLIFCKHKIFFKINVIEIIQKFLFVSRNYPKLDFYWENSEDTLIIYYLCCYLYIKWYLKRISLIDVLGKTWSYYYN